MRLSHRRGNDSECIGLYPGLYVVYPTGVGMIRRPVARVPERPGSSHRRGNDSSGQFQWGTRSQFIPQVWK